jgi:hypothetical protein
MKKGALNEIYNLDLQNRGTYEQAVRGLFTAGTSIIRRSSERSEERRRIGTTEKVSCKLGLKIYCNK